MTLPKPSPDWALFLDFDGTLVEIAERPDAVIVSEDLSHMLGRVSDALGGALAVVSGRRIEDIDRYLAPLVPPVAGLHGQEYRLADGTRTGIPIPEGLFDAARAEFARFAEKRHGVSLEDKGTALTLHFREAPDQETACGDVARAIVDQANGGIELMAGKMVFELKPAGINKGRVVAEIMQTPPFVGRRPVFIGDDVTDEFGFDTVNRLGGESIRVGPKGGSAAMHSVETVPALLMWLAELPDRIQPIQTPQPAS